MKTIAKRSPLFAPIPTRAESSDHLAPVAALLLVSGTVALVYEAVWQRQFSLVFGSAAPSTAAVLAAYFAGLGLGSLVVGKWAQSLKRPLRAYALLEAGVAGGALLVSPILDHAQMGYPSLYHVLSDHSWAFLTVRAVLTFFSVLIPTFCMGGTLPVLAALVDQGRRQWGITAGCLYVVNTTGAAFGALAFPFLLLPQLGVGRTIFCCAAINTSLAVAASVLDWRWAKTCSPRTGDNPPMRRQARQFSGSEEGSIFLPAFLSGAATFALQVFWNRVFAQVHENSMYSFAVIVAVVIVSLAIGGQLARVGLDRGMAPQRLLGGAWLLAGLADMAGPWLFVRMSDNLDYLPAAGSWPEHSLRLFILGSAVLIVPVSLLGVAMPALMEKAGRADGATAGQRLGQLLGANILGCVVGALAAGFIMPPLLGLWNSLLALSGLVLVAGLWQLLGSSKDGRERGLAYVVAVAGAAGLVLAVQADFPRVSVAVDQGERLVALTEGAHGITAVVERPGSRRLKLNNHYGLGGTSSTGDERMQAHVPLLLHANPRRVAFLGLGTGITTGGALFHPVESITVLELVPEVVSASRRHFSVANRGVLDEPRTRVIADDARHFLRGSGEKFDVIVGDLVVPWRQGEGSLFTLEQFAAGRAALAPRGIYCQWLPLFQLSEVELNILARTFLTVFPKTQVWRGDFSPTEPAIALIGFNDGSEPDVTVVQRRLAEMRRDPSNPQLRSDDAFWMNWIGELRPSDLPAMESRINREDRPWIELLGPRLHGSEGTDGIFFTGRRLQAWTDQVARSSKERSSTWLGDKSRAAQAGGVLAEMTLCLSEGNQTGVRRAQDELERLLPHEVMKLLFP